MVIAAAIGWGWALLAPPLERHWHFEPDYRLDRAPDWVEGGPPSRLPMLGPPEWVPPRLFGLQANDVRSDLLTLAEPASGAFSVELWVDDHVNHPVGALMAGAGADGRMAWSLGYMSALGNDKFAAGASLRFGPVEVHPGRAGGPLSPWRSYLHHLVGTYDGEHWRLYHNGVLVGEGDGPPAPFARVHLAGYLGSEPYMRLPNLVRDAWLHDHALSPAEVANAFAARKAEIVAASRGSEPGLRFTAGPYLTPPRDREQALLWETNLPARGAVQWGETAAFGHAQQFTEAARLHRTAMPGLKPDTGYFYRVTARAADGTMLDSGVLQFHTMPAAGAPLVFAAMGDTQERPFVNFRLSELVWQQRPHFLVLAGDLIGGEEDERRWHWTDEFFVGMGPLVSRVPVLAARGNGDVDLVDPVADRRVFDNFSRYHNQPDGGRGYYALRIGDAEFFVLDGNLAMRERWEPGFRAAQRAWLKAALQRSTARWKIAVHHQPAWSADDDDYGDSRAGPTTAGDPEIRHDFVDLYERYGVDLVLSGHIHSYARSWPLIGGTPACGGVTYLQLGGGGGDTEHAAALRPPQIAALYDGFHVGLFRLWRDTLDIEIRDLGGKVRDRVHLAPRSAGMSNCAPALSQDRRAPTAMQRHTAGSAQ